jgi:hypothetical protein
MSSDLLKALTELQQFAAAANRQEYYRKLRDPDKSEVIDYFYTMINVDDPTINKTTGVKHTVESMVQDLQARVGLDAVLGKKEDAQPPLSRRASVPATEDELFKALSEFSRKYFLISSPFSLELLLQALVKTREKIPKHKIAFFITPNFYKMNISVMFSIILLA